SGCDQCRVQAAPVRRAPQQSALPASARDQNTHAAAPPIVHDVLRMGGQPLDSSVRGFMEARFRHDFSGVRIHSDALAGASARAVHAAAYTVGNHVVLAGGGPTLVSGAGRRLLAHELAHVIQGGGESTWGPSLAIGDAADRCEVEADASAERVMAVDVSAPEVSSGPGLAVSGLQMLRREPAPTPTGTPASPPVPTPAPPTCKLDRAKDCATYEEWLATFPTSTFGTGTDTNIAASMPADLAGLIGGPLGQGKPDCADVAIILRSYYLKARGQSFSFLVGRDEKSAERFTIGKPATDKELKVCLIGTGTESFQETRSQFALVDFYKKKGKPLLNLKALLAAGLKTGDMFVWKRLPSMKGNFQGHAQTVQRIRKPVFDSKDPTKVVTAGFVVVVQGNMSAGAGTGKLEQRNYSFKDLTGSDDGDADIGEEPRNHEEGFFGAGPWKG
ncbi:MAG: hypothetical protein QOF30_3320, partial [Acidimicrobiaceae bacterium]|nr:hypothetical protein [Acidimicrobiaceae bacterium]